MRLQGGLRSEGKGVEFDGLRHGKDLDAIEAEFARAQEERSAKEAALGKSEALIERLSESVELHIRQMDALKQRMGDRLRKTFSRVLSQRGYVGDLDVLWDEEAVRLNVAPSRALATEASNFARQQLSGGEKSFTTVAYTLAVGSVTTCQFRAMDEFDVFMVGGVGEGID